MQILKNLAFPLLLFLFSIGYLASARGLGPMLDNGRLSPSFYPSILGALAVLFCALHLWRSVRETLATDRSTTRSDEHASESSGKTASSDAVGSSAGNAVPAEDTDPDASMQQQAFEQETSLHLFLARYRTTLIILATALFIAVFQQIGYLYSSFFYVLAIITIFSDTSRLLSRALVSLSISLGVFLLFTQAFNVRLPGFWS